VALARPEVLWLMTIPGVDATVALSIVAAVGDFTRFRSPERLVSYLGLNPRVRGLSRRTGGRWLPMSRSFPSSASPPGPRYATR
jgi:transposase